MTRENNGLQAARVDQLGESTLSAVAVLQDGDAVAGSSRCISGRAAALATRPLHERGLGNRDRSKKKKSEGLVSIRAEDVALR